MKAKELAEELLKYPDYEVQASVCVGLPTYDEPYEKCETCEVYGVDEVKEEDGVIILDVG